MPQATSLAVQVLLELAEDIVPRGWRSGMKRSAWYVACAHRCLHALMQRTSHRARLLHLTQAAVGAAIAACERHSASDTAYRAVVAEDEWVGWCTIIFGKVTLRFPSRAREGERKPAAPFGSLLEPPTSCQTCSRWPRRKGGRTQGGEGGRPHTL